MPAELTLVHGLLLYESQATAHAFDLFDQDKDGFLKGNELKYFIAFIHTEIGIDEVTEDNIAEVKSTFDANNDGDDNSNIAENDDDTTTANMRPGDSEHWLHIASDAQMWAALEEGFVRYTR